MPKKPKYNVKDLIEAAQGSMGIWQAIIAKAKIPRGTLAKYIQQYPELRKVIEDERERGLDFAEAKLLEQIKANDLKAVMFYLERKGATRGWSEQKKVNLEGSAGEPVQTIICFGDELPAELKGKK